MAMRSPRAALSLLSVRPITEEEPEEGSEAPHSGGRNSARTPPHSRLASRNLRQTSSAVAAACAQPAKLTSYERPSTSIANERRRRPHRPPRGRSARRRAGRRRAPCRSRRRRRGWRARSRPRAARRSRRRARGDARLSDAAVAGHGLRPPRPGRSWKRRSLTRAVASGASSRPRYASSFHHRSPSHPPTLPGGGARAAARGRARDAEPHLEAERGRRARAARVGDGAAEHDGHARRVREEQPVDDPPRPREPRRRRARATSAETASAAARRTPPSSPRAGAAKPGRASPDAAMRPASSSAAMRSSHAYASSSTRTK